MNIEKVLQKYKFTPGGHTFEGGCQMFAGAFVRNQVGRKIKSRSLTLKAVI